MCVVELFSHFIQFMNTNRQVVSFGLEMNKQKTRITSEVEHFLTQFYGMLAYLINTIIFLLAGIIIGYKAMADIKPIDFAYTIFIYICLALIRGLAS